MKNLISIQDAYIARMLRTAPSKRGNALVSANAWRAGIDGLRAIGFTQAQAERAMYDARDMVALERIARS